MHVSHQFFLHLGGRCCKLFSQTPVEEIDETRFKTACLKLWVVVCIQMLKRYPLVEGAVATCQLRDFGYRYS